MLFGRRSKCYEGTYLLLLSTQGFRGERSVCEGLKVDHPKGLGVVPNQRELLLCPFFLLSSTDHGTGPDFVGVGVLVVGPCLS